MAWFDIENYKKNPYELTDEKINSMPLKDSMDVLKYIQDILTVRGDELRIHSSNATKIASYVRENLS